MSLSFASILGALALPLGFALGFAFAFGFAFVRLLCFAATGSTL